ncbi:hypothetical protein UY3_00995 [Chelonia mydas]|uniref:Uncharacterized protein n=1 Tax=Chelonia mydas TaxID=8469 RepID=M7BX21_CHEMY|nr:hypothetical protein UY3_00995 [Chelonia mydas]
MSAGDTLPLIPPTLLDPVEYRSRRERDLQSIQQVFTGPTKSTADALIAAPRSPSAGMHQISKFTRCDGSNVAEIHQNQTLKIETYPQRLKASLHYRGGRCCCNRCNRFSRSSEDLPNRQHIALQSTPVLYPMRRVSLFLDSTSSSQLTPVEETGGTDWKNNQITVEQDET